MKLKNRDLYKRDEGLGKSRFSGGWMDDDDVPSMTRDVRDGWGSPGGEGG